MRNDKNENSTPLSLKITLGVVIAIAAAVIGSLIFINGRQRNMTFRSRYTYVREMALHSTDSMELEDEARSWFDSFIGQHTGTFVPPDVRLKDLRVEDISVIDPDEGIVRIYFSAIPAADNPDYFSDWNPRFVNGRMYCDWAVKFGIKTTEDKNDGIYVISIADNSNYVPDEKPADPDNPDDPGDSDDYADDFVQYRIRSSSLEISFDGGETYSAVPVAIKNLMLSDDDTSVLESGSYVLSQAVSAFLTGGATINGEKVPVSVIYSQDQGESWVTTPIDQIFDVSKTYIKMFNENDGVMVIAYAKAGEQEFSKIYRTRDGCETWETVGNGPENFALKGVLLTDPDTAFFTYHYNENVKNNLRVSHDGGKTFTEVTWPEGKFDENTENKDLKWSDVFKEATVPVQEPNGNLVVYLTQGDGGTYMGGQAAAKYVSADNGNTWNFAEIVQSR